VAPIEQVPARDGDLGVLPRPPGQPGVQLILESLESNVQADLVPVLEAVGDASRPSTGDAI
jgi:hypothetical protein